MVGFWVVPGNSMQGEKGSDRQLSRGPQNRGYTRASENPHPRRGLCPVFRTVSSGFRVEFMLRFRMPTSWHLHGPFSILPRCVFVSLFLLCLLFTLFSRNRPKLLLFLICAELPVSYDSSQCLRQRMVVGGRIQIRTQLSVCASYASFSASYGSCFFGIGE